MNDVQKLLDFRNLITSVFDKHYWKYTEDITNETKIDLNEVRKDLISILKEDIVDIVKKWIEQGESLNFSFYENNSIEVYGGDLHFNDLLSILNCGKTQYQIEDEEWEKNTDIT